MIPSASQLVLLYCTHIIVVVPIVVLCDIWTTGDQGCCASSATPESLWSPCGVFVNAGFGWGLPHLQTFKRQNQPSYLQPKDPLFYRWLLQTPITMLHSICSPFAATEDPLLHWMFYPSLLFLLSLSTCAHKQAENIRTNEEQGLPHTKIVSRKFSLCCPMLFPPLL